MKNISLWTLAASLFCSLAVTDAARDVGRSVQLAGMGNPAGVERTLAEFAGRMGVSAPAASVPPAAKTLLIPVNLPPGTDKLAVVAHWVRNTGRHADFDGRVAQRMGLISGTADMPALVRSYGTEAEGQAVFFLVFPGNMRDVIFVRKDFRKKIGGYWLVRDGNISIMFLNQDGELKAQTSDGFRHAGLKVLDYFYSHLPPEAVAEKDSSNS